MLRLEYSLSAIVNFNGIKTLVDYGLVKAKATFINGSRSLTKNTPTRTILEI